jgi:hypothetical protein
MPTRNIHIKEVLNNQVDKITEPADARRTTDNAWGRLVAEKEAHK